MKAILLLITTTIFLCCSVSKSSFNDTTNTTVFSAKNNFVAINIYIPKDYGKNKVYRVRSTQDTSMQYDYRIDGTIFIIHRDTATAYIQPVYYNEGKYKVLISTVNGFEEITRDNFQYFLNNTSTSR